MSVHLSNNTLLKIIIIIFSAIILLFTIIAKSNKGIFIILKFNRINLHVCKTHGLEREHSTRSLTSLTQIGGSATSLRSAQTISFIFFYQPFFSKSASTFKELHNRAKDNLPSHKKHRSEKISPL